MPRCRGNREKTRDALVYGLTRSLLPDDYRFGVEAAVPSYLYHPDSGMQTLYHLNIGCFVHDQLVGGIEINSSRQADPRKWAFLRTFGFDVLEIRELNPDGSDPEFPEVAAVGSTFPGGPTQRSLVSEPLTRRPYHPRLEGYPPLDQVQAWEKQTDRMVLRDYDLRLGEALGANLQFFLPFCRR